MTRARYTVLLTLATLGLALAGDVYAQTGTVAGTVRDEAGAPLPGVNVVLDRKSVV